MRDFLTALRGFGITGCTVDVDTPEDERKLGETADAFEVCRLERPAAEPHPSDGLTMIQCFPGEGGTPMAITMAGEIEAIAFTSEVHFIPF